MDHKGVRSYDKCPCLLVVTQTIRWSVEGEFHFRPKISAVQFVAGREAKKGFLVKQQCNLRIFPESQVQSEMSGCT